MLFNSYIFVFIFLPITILLYFGLNHLGYNRVAKSTLVIASLIFYAYFNLSYLPIILSSIIVNYGISNTLYKSSTDDSLKRKFLLWTGILFNVGMLGYFKYTDFMISNINAIFATSLILKNILLPLGISFFTFQQLAFIIDSYKESNSPPPDFLDYCNFVTFFPQLIAGPIVLPEEMLPQFADNKNHKLIAKNILDGLFIFSLGLVKKVVIADSISVFSNAGHNMDVSHFTMAEAWLISLSYTIQLYFDFSGYCDMAIGIGRIFNINLPINFNAPYRAKSFGEFWRRWHITLNRFLTQYLYIPLGGSRKGTRRTLVNILIVFLISGIWHGAGWTFIIWGILHGIGVAINRIWSKHGFKIPGFLSMFITFFFINILWVIFRADNLQRAWLIIRSMFDNHQFYLSKAYTSSLPSLLPNTVNMIILFVGLFMAFIGPTAYELMINKDTVLANRTKVLATTFCFVLGVIFMARVVTFLYFNF